VRDPLDLKDPLVPSAPLARAENRAIRGCKETGGNMAREGSAALKDLQVRPTSKFGSPYSMDRSP